MASFSDEPVGGGVAIATARRRRPGRDALRSIAGSRHAGAFAVALPLVGLAFVRFGASGRFLVAAFVVAVLCVLSAIDLAEHRLPNRIVLPSAAAVLAAQIALSPDRALEWTLAAVGAALVLLVPRLFYPAGLGMGDVKLALLLGAALGSAVVTALFVGVVAAAAYALLLLARDGAGARRQAFPLGPFLAFGAIVELLL
jgi:leader peptidase (prepilin peptidase) / N-methyltransferase